MDNTELKDFLYREIPLSEFMGINIIEASDLRVKITAPLGPSQNHLDTAFGGSIGAILILSCYAWLFHRLKASGFECHVLIKEGKTDYIYPVKEELKAICLPPASAEYEKFFQSFQRKGLAKISLDAFLETSDGQAAKFTGVFVAQKSKL
ncbi:MAG TPA: YiiD C-terminal domain-containing protein [Flavobacterium sp.]|jgi:thioesterase domain-containing protein